MDNKVESFESFVSYMNDYMTDFIGLDIVVDGPFEYYVKLNGVLSEAELLGLPLTTALHAPAVGMRLNGMNLSEVACRDNSVAIPLSCLIGDVSRSGVRMDIPLMKGEERKVCLLIGAHIYDVQYNDLGMNFHKLMTRFGNLRDVIVPIVFNRNGDGSVDFSTLKVENGYDHYPSLKHNDAILDIGRHLPEYFNYCNVSELAYCDRASVEMRDRFVSSTLVENYREIWVPTDMMLDSIKILQLTGDDVRYSQSYRTARFIENVVIWAGKSKDTTIVLK